MTNPPLPQIKQDARPSSHNKRSFFSKIDQLPKGPQWTCDIFSITGDVVGEDGQLKSEEVELWRRNPVELITDLLSNPSFAEYTHHVPEKVFTEKDGRRIRWFGEMWTTDWWWEVLVSFVSSMLCHTSLPRHSSMRQSLNL